MHSTKRITSGFLILGMMAAAPLAFAQQTTPTDGQQSPPGSSTQDAAAQSQSQSSGGQGLSWADLDTDGNGNLSKTEAQRHAGLAAVFAEADTNGDNELTADEYRAFVEKQQSNATGQ
ncbi:calcium-binding protein [Pseudoxanthomonas suwonensis]|uniref:calcium-binding protein n=1 Tax=Pseudoxanthomonas suwonensis TaxID=314722 RepID=UPI000490D9E4|nr:calcium-binding protein [Pseudoxanthomonas suwonensis]